MKTSADGCRARPLLRGAAWLALCLAIAGCAHESAPPSGLDVATTRSTDRQRYVVALQPLEDAIVINRLHAWQITVRTPAGEPVSHAQIAVDGGMPQHGHGLPTAPQVTQELGEGRYLLEGMKFSMTGWWEIKLRIESARGVDQVTFNRVISLPLPAQVAASAARP